MIGHVREWKLNLVDLQMDCIAFGSGSKPLIMVQGLNTRGIRGAGVSLAWMYRIFSKDYRVYLFDRREDLWEGITVRELAADLAAAMDALEIRNADVFGVSQGGMIAQYLAIDRPDLVNKLVLAVTASRNNSTLEAAVGNWIRMTEREQWKQLVADMAERMYTEGYLRRYRPLLPLLALVQKPKDVRRFITLAKACLTCNVYDIPEKITCPVFVIGACQDQVVGGAASVEIAEKMNCMIYMYDNFGHAVYEEAKDFNQRVIDFFRDDSLNR